jgi:ferredoxin
MQLHIDHEACTGHGRCYALAPELFDADDEGYGRVTAPDSAVPAALEDAARRAVNNCPERAITLDAEA